MRVFWSCILGLMVLAGSLLLLRGPERSETVAPGERLETTPFEIPIESRAMLDAVEQTENAEFVPSPLRPFPLAQREPDYAAEIARLSAELEELSAQVQTLLNAGDSALPLPTQASGPRSERGFAGMQDIVRALPPMAMGVPEGIGDELNALLGIDASEVPEFYEGAQGGDAGAQTAQNANTDAPFEIGGEGTADDPYVVPWEMLVSARQVFNPRKGKTELPGWTQTLNGNHVRLSGYVLLPLVQTNTDELLLMRNQWDGCCIGVPPTPYDAIEVKLSKATRDLTRARMNYGTISGVFRADPYLVKDWLVGLYVIDDAELRVLGF